MGAGANGRDGGGGARGLRDDGPVASGVAVAAGLGGFWGLVGYTILWEGAPIAVDRAFTASAAGTLLLLPVRLVIWAIELAESAAGRSFDLSRTHQWIAFAASVLGAGMAVAALIGARALLRRTGRGARS